MSVVQRLSFNTDARVHALPPIDSTGGFTKKLLPPIASPVTKLDPTNVPAPTTLPEKQKVLKAPRIVYNNGHIKSITAMTVIKTDYTTQSIDDTAAPVIVSGGEDKCINFWSVESGSLIMTLDGHSARVTGLAMCCPGRAHALLVSCSWDETIRVWPVDFVHKVVKGMMTRDAVEGVIKSKCAVVRGHKNRVSDVDCLEYDALGITEHLSSNQSLVVSASCDNTMRVYAVQVNDEGDITVDFLFKIFDLSTTWWLCLRLFNSPALGPVVVSGGKDYSLKVWALQRPIGEAAVPSSGNVPSTPLRIIEKHGSRVLNIGIFLENDQTIIVTTCKDMVIRLIEMDSGELLRTLEGHTSFINTLNVFTSASNGTILIVTGTEKGNLRVWSTTGEVLRMFNGHTDSATALTAFDSPDSTDQIIVVSGSKDKTVRTWLYAEEKSITTLEHLSISLLNQNPANSSIATAVQVTTSDKETSTKKKKKTVKVCAIAVYAEDNQPPIIITGCDDSTLRAWRLKRSNQTGVLKWFTKAHSGTEPISCVRVYIPPLNYILPRDNTNKIPLSEPFIISASRDGTIVLSSLSDGTPLSRCWEGHLEAITSLRVFNGYYSPGDAAASVPAFIATGSEDNNVHVWPLSQDITVGLGHGFNREDTVAAGALGGPSAVFRKLIGHEFDVTDVLVFFRPEEEDSLDHKGPGRGDASSRSHGSGSNAALKLDTSTILLPVWKTTPVIVSSSMDSTVRLWSYRTANILAIIGPLNSHGVSLEMTGGKLPILAIGGSDGAIKLWQLVDLGSSNTDGEREISAHSVVSLEHHKDEVQSLAVCDAEGQEPVLVSCSWDCTVIVWSLHTMKRLKTIEGHKAEVTGMVLFSPGGSDMAVASCSNDGKVRILYDFLNRIPKPDIIEELYKFDSKQIGAKKFQWVRISEVVEIFGPDQFFTIYYFLFTKSLEKNRSDFIKKFLPGTNVGLRKSNLENSLFQMALSDGKSGSITASRVINSCWCNFYKRKVIDDGDIIYSDPAESLLQTKDFLALAEKSPKEFEKLICSIKLVPAKGDKPFDVNSRILDSSTGSIRKWTAATPSSKQSEDTGDDEVEVEKTHVLMWLPVNFPYSNEMMLAFTKASIANESVEIFNSEVGVLALDYAWKLYGQWVFLRAMLVHMIYVTLLSISNYCFQNWMNPNDIFDVEQQMFLTPMQDAHVNFNSTTNATYIEQQQLTYLEGRPRAAQAIAILVLIFSGVLVYRELGQLFNEGFSYFESFWNQSAIVFLACNIAGTSVRLYYQQDNQISILLLSLGVIPTWFNILYYLRAFELTGPLVSMILRIAHDMVPFTFVLFIVVVGYSQAFWLLSFEADGYAFAGIKNSLITSFNFMLGGYDPTTFDGLPLKELGILLTTLYMVLVNLLLLNLLIALMGDSYGSVREKGIAQWKLEQCQLILEQDCLPSVLSDKEAEAAQNKAPTWIYVMKGLDEIAEEDENTNDESNPHLLGSVRSAVADELNQFKKDIMAEIKGLIK